MAEEAEVTEEEEVADWAMAAGEILPGPSCFELNLQDQEMLSVMKNQVAKIARLLLCVLGLVVVQGCATPQDHGSRKSWSQISAEQEREQRLNSSPEDWGLLP